MGPYRLARLIRAGHSCQVWEAVKDATNERFAIKMLKQDSRGDREEIGYLKHEYEVAKDLNHPNVVRVYDFDMNQGAAYLVLELCSALNLKQILREGPESVAYLAERIIEQSLLGLHYFNEKGWIHCDIKPDNLLVDDDGNVKLIDFTISQKPKRSLLAFFDVKAPVKGTRSYMSPEQIRGELLDPRSDVYSFGCVIFEILAGRPPFTGSTPNELLEKHLRTAVPSVLVYNNNVTREMNDLLRRILSKKREIRPESMWEVIQEMRNFQVFTKKPPQPKFKLSELDAGPVVDADSLKQLPKRPTDEDK